MDGCGSGERCRSCGMVDSRDDGSLGRLRFLSGVSGVVVMDSGKYCSRFFGTNTVAPISFSSFFAVEIDECVGLCLAGESSVIISSSLIVL